MTGFQAPQSVGTKRRKTGEDERQALVAPPADSQPDPPPILPTTASTIPSGGLGAVAPLSSKAKRTMSDASDRRRMDSMSPDERLEWLVDQNARYRRANALDLQSAGIEGAPLVESQDQATRQALMRIVSVLKEDQEGPRLRAWINGEQQGKEEEVVRQKYAETGDYEHARRVARKEAGYDLPIETMDAFPALAGFEPEKLQPLKPDTFRDFLVEPVTRVLSGFAQSNVDFFVGAANLLGADLKSADMYARMHGVMRAMGGEGWENYDSVERQEMLRRAFADEQRGTGTAVVQGGAEFAGSLLGMTKGMGRVAFGGGALASSNVLKNAPRWVKSAAGNVVGFGTFDFVSAKGGDASMSERVDSALIGGAMGVVATVANALGRGAMRFLLGTERTGSKLAGAEANSVFNKWLLDAKLVQGASETRERFVRRAINQFVGEGAPGLKMDARKLFGIGARAAVEAGTFTAADMAFGRSLYEQMLGEQGEHDNWQQFLSTALGLAFLHSSGSWDLLRARQRRAPMPPVDLRGPDTPLLPGSRRPVVDTEFSVQPKPPAPAGALPEQAVGEVQRAGEAVRAEFQRGEQDYQRRQAEERWRQGPETDIEESLVADVARGRPIEMPYAPPGMLRLGWKPEAVEPNPLEVAEGEGMVQRDPTPEPAEPRRTQPVMERDFEGGPSRMPADFNRAGRTQPRFDEGQRQVVRFQGGEFAYEVEGGEARPNSKMRVATGLPESMPVDKFVEKVAKITLFNQLQGKALLPGQSITMTDWKTDVKDPDDAAPVMRKIEFGQVMERPLAPEGEWKPVDTFKPRPPDSVPPMQRAVANDLAAMSNSPDLKAEDQALLGSVVGVLNTVSPDKDVAVAETVQALQSGVLAETFAKDPAAGIKATAEMLTTKSPEVVVNELASAGDPSPGSRGASVGTGEGEQGKPLREGERGSFDVVEALQQLAGFVADNPGTRFIGATYLERVRRQVGPDMARRFRQVQTTFSEIRGKLQPHMQALAETGSVLGGPGRLTDNLSELRFEHVRPGLRIATSRWFEMMETEWSDRTGRTRSTLTTEDRALVDPVDGVMRDTRAIAHTLGVKVGGKTVRATRKDNVLPRHFTASGAKRTRELDPALIEALAHLNNATPAQVAKWLAEDGYTDARSLHRDDPIEHIRKIKLWPEFIEVDGRMERQLETRPVRIAEQVINQFALRMSMIQEFGPDNGAKSGQPYSDVITKNAKGESAQRLLAEVFRVASGMKPDDEVGPHERQFRQLMRPFTTLYMAGKLSSLKATIQNLVEPIASAMAMLGPKEVMGAYGKVAQRIASGEFRQMQGELVDEGGFLRMIHDRVVEFSGTKGGVVAGAQDVANLSGRTLMVLFDLGQDFADTVIRQAVGDRVNLMRAGDGGATGAGFAMSMGFSAADARALAEGTGKPKDYDFLLSMGLPSFSGRGDHPLNRTPLKKQTMRILTPFLNYVIKQVGRLQQLGSAVREAKTTQERDEASIALLKFLGGHAIGGALANGLITLAVRGLDGLEDDMQDWSTPAGAAGKLGLGVLTGLFGALGATFTQGMEMLFAPDKDDRTAAASRIVQSLSAPLGGAVEFGEFMLGLVNPTADTRYRGHSPLGKVWLGAQTLAPILRDVNRGLAGFAGLALTDDPDTRAALTKLNKVKDKLGIGDQGHGEIDEFNTLMRGFELELRKPRALDRMDVGEIARRIVAAMPPTDDGEPDVGRAVRSLLLRRKLDWLERYTEENPKEAAAFEQAMGPKHMATLRGYDLMLEQIAEHVRG